MKDYPWYSVDGSSWGAGFRYGTVLLFDENLGKFIKINLRDKVTAWAQRKLLNSYGYRCSDLAIEREYDRAKICAMSAEAYMRAERWLRARNGEVVIPNRGGFRGDDKGFKVYITDANSQRIIAAQGKHERHY